jgi:acyl transferase domain-containing protein/acyl carrier protein
MSDEQKLREYLRRVTGDLRTAHRRVRELEQRRREPIAIVGMSCRYPATVSTPDELWQLVSTATDAISELPTDRGWDVERLYHPDPDHPGTTYCQGGGFLSDVAGFDAGFFGIGPREALAMDPQQRLVLELAWEAFEDAGIDPTALAGTVTGVFTGAFYQDYGPCDGWVVGHPHPEGFVQPLSSASMVAGRVSYLFGLEGPALTVDTVCSSSLVALHLACQALRRGECSLALAGGVTVMSHPALLQYFGRQRALSPDGRCRSFGAGANGTGFSDGAGHLVLERLSDARRLGHRVLAVVRGSAVNQDGASNGLTAPNGPSQERVIREALADAGLSAAEVDAVEAHGTGTVLGDPIEAQALLGTYGQGRTDGPLRLGSIKSNIGHTSAGAGVAGVIKMVKALEHELLPATLHVDEPSPHVEWSAGEVRLLVEAEPWPAGERPRRAGISSFGASGTNAHVVIEEPPALQEDPPAARPVTVGSGGEDERDAPTAGEAAAPPAAAGAWSSGAVPLLVSGRGAAALGAQAGRLREHLTGQPDAGLLDVAFSLAGRAALADRGVVMGHDRASLLAGLDALAHGGVAEGVVRGVARSGRPVFVFPGQGAQWEGMAVELLDSSEVFAAALRACGEALEELVEWRVEDVLRGVEGAPTLERVDVVQPVSFAVMVALAELWGSFGVRPSVVVGHSQGEIAAACVAGGLSLRDAARVVVLRSQLLGEVLAGRGGMVSVALGVGEVQERLERWGAQLSVAAVNGPSAVIVSGETQALDELLAACEEDGVWARRIAVDYASHSAAVEELRERLVEALAGIEPVSCGVPFFSTARGELIDTAELDGEYWYRSLRERVRFEEAVQALAQEASAFVEMSPHPVLGVAVGETLEAMGVEGRVGLLGSLRRGEGGWARFVQSLAEAWVAGVPVVWGGFFAGSGATRVDLPRYAFQRERFWLEPGVSGGDVGAAGLGAADHPLLGAAVQIAGGEEWLFTGRLSLDTHAWLADHVVFENVVVPGTALLEIVLAAGRAAGCETVEELTFQAPLMLAQGAAVQLQVTVGEPDGEGRRPVGVYSRPQAAGGGAQDGVGAQDGADEDEESSGWTRHAGGTLLADSAGADGDRPPAQWPPAGAQEMDVELLYDRLAEIGFGYGPVFQGVRAAWRLDGEIYTEVALDDDVVAQATRFGVHPALLDAALHGFFFTAEEDGEEPSELPLPFSLGGVSLAQRGTASLRTRMTRTDASTMRVTVWDEDGEPVLAMRSLAFRMVQAGQLAGAQRGEQGSLFRNTWVQAPTGEGGEQPRLAALGAIAVPGLPEESCERYESLVELAAAIAEGAPAPAYVFASAPTVDAEESGLAPAAHLGARQTLALVQAWLAESRLAESQLVLVTRGAVAVAEEETPALAAAAVWGLVRSAQSEHPDRLVLVDLDASASPEAEREPRIDAPTSPDAEREPRIAWPALLASSEPQLAVRGEQAYVPRLEPVTAEPAAAPALDPDGTVLLTGGTGGLGALVARHLAAVRGARHMVLASRAGPRADGVQELLAELGELGCEARAVACDVADRGELAALLASIPAERPLRAVVHAAGVLEDGLVELLTAEQLERVMRPKVDAALHLHELTRELELTDFVLFSSAAGLLGAPGQANYAAANAFLDALAQDRRAQGLAGKALAWGLWEAQSGMTAGVDRARLARLGVSSLPTQSALELLDAGRGAGEALLVAARLEPGTLRKQARVGVLPPLLSGLVRMPARSARSGGSLARRLAGVPESEWSTVVLELVRAQAAAVLAHGSAADVDPERAFKDLGFDSLGAVELRNRLMQVTGLRLPVTLVFDQPNCRAIAELLRSRIEVDGDAQAPARRAGGRAPGRRVGSEEPIALVGMACRFPGGVHGPRELWEMLAEGRDAVTGFPTDRGWDLAGLYDPDPDHPRTTYAREGGFVEGIADFDADFFGISPREALVMDPQQRLLLETAWEALEDAGIDPTSLRGSQSGVFVGVTSGGYAVRVPEHLEGLQLTGNTTSVTSGRVSYTLGLEGPAVSVDTACSSSLVALHLACRALRDGECTLALAGGVTLMASPGLFVEFSRQRGLAPDGRCKAFAAAADGVGWAEGVGLLTLERLSEAQRLGHRVLALVRGSAINQDGASNGLTAPNGPSQERVIRQALADAGLTPGEVDAVEAHGTGTRLGDPIEAQALLATYGQQRPDGPVRVGSIKSNIGHCIAASGVAGVIKMTLAMRHGLLPRTLHVDEPTRAVDWSEGEVRLLNDPELWPAGERPRRAGVSSFGISGTNAHVILEEPPRPAAEQLAPQPAGDPDGQALGAVPWLVSGRSEAALRAQAERLHTHLCEHPELEPLGVACALATARAQHEWRAAVVAGERERLLAGLSALSLGEPAGGLWEGRASGGRTAFMLTGQGAQRAGMGAELHAALPLFREAFDEVCAELDRSREALAVGAQAPSVLGPGRSLREVVFAAEDSPEAALLHHTELAQAALFAYEVALARVLEAWGVRPDLLIGHSIGEVVAAHLAGVLSLADACTLVAARGRLMGALPEGGAMLALEASAQEAAQSLAGRESQLTLAAVNGPLAVVVSGDADAVQTLAEEWGARGRKTKRLRVSHAFHSQRMDPMLAAFGEVVSALTFAPPRIAVVSNVTGALVGEETLCDPAYWMRHVRETVRFADGVGALERAGARCFIEVGPDGVLCALSRECLSDDALERAAVVPAQRAGDPEVQTLLGALAQAHTAGVPVAWQAFFAGRGARPVELPTYAFQRERYWLTPQEAGGEVGAAGLGAADHPLLGAALQVAGGDEWLLTGRLSLATHPWIGDHAVLDTVLLPGTAFLELAFTAGRRAGVETVEELTLQAPLVLGEGAVQLQVSVAEADEEGRRTLAIHSRPEPSGDGGEGGEGQWTCHATGTLAPAADVAPALARLQAQAWPPAGAEPVETEYLYDLLAEAGLGYGDSFQAVRGAWRRGEELFVETALGERHAAAAGSFRVHPALLDATLHPLFGEGDVREARMPFSWSDVRLHRDAVSVLRACITVSGSGTLHIAALDELGEPVLSVGSLLGRPADRAQLAGARGRGEREQVFEPRWVRLAELPAAEEQERCAVLGEARLEGVEAERYENLEALCAAVAAGEPAPGVVFAPAPVPAERSAADATELAQEVRQATVRTVELLQAYLAAQELADTRLVLLTHGAAAVEEQEELDLAAAPLAGLLASAQPEHPGRFLLVDLDGGDGEVPWAQLLEADEPRVAVRAGAVYAPRLTAVAVPAAPAPPAAAPESGPSVSPESTSSPTSPAPPSEPAPAPALDPEGTVLITGGTGGLGALVARHLAGTHGVRHLLLLSRRGEEAPGVAELLRALGELGAHAHVVACDVADREAVRAALDALPAAHPLTAVVHAAGVLEDGLLESLTAEQVERAMRPKVDAALNLHELTAGADLAAFVLFSSVTATIGSPGQGNYAAANAFLDALARHRRARGLAGSSLAWGLWAETSGMAGAIGEAGVARLARLGLETLSSERGLELLDAALALDRPLLALVALDTGVLRAQARMGALPAPLRGVVRAPAGRPGAARGSLARRLAGVSDDEREGVVLELVCAHVAAVLGHDSPRSLDTERPFTELGFDSLASVELRNRLYQATGLRLPATLVFDHPTPAAVARFLLERVAGSRRHATVVAHKSSRTEDPIAIVGMSCRYPGDVRSSAELWTLVESGVDAVTGFPSDRGWDLERLYDPDPDHPGTSYAREGGFLHDVADFDARFFGIAPREALTMDPQQRLVLEVAWEAFEDARIDPLSLRGTETGVFCGVMYQDYGYVVNRSATREEAEGYATVGMAGSVVSGRMAYVFGLEGPAVTIDTACSSSLVALHLASQSLLRGECSMALAGGVTVLANPAVFIDFSRQRALARDGRSKSFANAADGVGWAEGVGLLVVERLSDARRRGHRVLGLVRGSAVNQDGASNGLTAPNGPSQERVIRQALANAGLSPGEVDAVEAHGTGTMLGDPIEAQALLATYGQERAGEPLWLGSIKSNFGHTQAAAGAAGVMKMLLAMRHGVLPRTLHLDEPSPHVDWSQGEVSLLGEPVPWPAGARPRRAGISSFGVSGTNAHVIVEEPPPATPAPERPATGAAGLAAGMVPVVLSARVDEALRAFAGKLLERVRADRELSVADVARTLAERTTFECRAVAVVEDRESLLACLEALAAGESDARVLTGTVGAGQHRPVFVFPGQGAQWEGMAVELLDSSEVFAAALRACGEALEELVEWRVEDVLRGVEGAPTLERVDVVQPVSFAVMVALAELWGSFGVRPSVVVGHSQGEIAAACVAGGLSLRDAARVVVLRSRLLGEVLAGRGGMVSVALGVGEVQERLERWGARLSVAAVNGPSAVVVSGETQALDELLAACGEDGVWARRVAVDYASHSAAVEELRERLVEALAGIEPVSCGVPFFSTARGELVDTAELDGEYWYRSLRERVRFEEAVRALAQEAGAFVEVSPHPVLGVAVGETLEAMGVEGRVGVLGSLRRGEGGWGRFVQSLAEAWVAGVPVAWGGFFAGSGAQQVDLPTYAFRRQRFWPELAQDLGDVAATGLIATGHPLLGVGVRAANRDEWLFTRRVSLTTHPWIGDHAVLGTVLLPGTAFVELALAAGRHVGCEAVEELTLEAPLVVGEESVQLQVVLGEPHEGRRAIAVYARPYGPATEDGDEEAAWTRHAGGTLAAAAAHVEPDATLARAAAEWPPADAEPVEVEFLYDLLAEVGLEYGPLFQGVRAAWRREGEIFAEVALPEQHAAAAQPFGVHPALFDAALHTFGLVQGGPEPSGPPLPFSFTGVRLHGEGCTALRVLSTPGAAGELRLAAVDDAGEPVLTVDSLLTRPLDPGQLAGVGASRRSPLFALAWAEVPLPSGNGGPFRCALLGEAPFAGLDAERYGDPRALAEAVAEGAPVPDTVLVAVAPDADGGTPEAARATTGRVLELLQAWLAEERLAETRLVVVTRGAVAARDGEAPDLAVAPVWGLVRSAQSENPDRLLLVDLDPDGERSAAEPPWAALCASEEAQLAVRDGRAWVPRLARVSGAEQEPAVPFDPEGTILITGGTGDLGALFARHLAGAHGVRRLVLTSRRGPEAEGAHELVAELAGLGCEAQVVACDVADRAQCEALVAGLDEEWPLQGVIHAAGVLDDGLVGSLDVEQLERVMRPKVDGAWHMHELAERAGAELVLFSSAAGALGSPGQANYAAGNAFLDALAQYRRARGLAGRSLAWGLWAQQGGMTAALDEAGLARLARLGVLQIEPTEGFEMFDAARGVDQALLVPLRVDVAALGAGARAGMLPALLRSLVRTAARRAGEQSLARRLAGVPAEEWKTTVLDLVRGEVAAVLGYDTAEEIDPQTVFTDLGFDSLAAVELRNRLSHLTGLRLPATLVFTYASIKAVADHVYEEFPRNRGGEEPSAARAQDDGGTLSTLLRHAHARGAVLEAVPVLVEASKLLPTIDSFTDGGEAPRCVQLASGAGAPKVICIPTFMAGAGAHQFARLAAGFGGARTVAACPLPGFSAGESVPGSWSVVIDTLAASVRAAVEDDPFVLVGYSIGGIVAHALAAQLEADGTPPAGVVLIDTYAPSGAEIGLVLARVLELILEMDGELMSIDDHNLMAMGAYLRLYGEWQPAALEAPAMLIRASEPLGDGFSVDLPLPDRPGDTIEVTGHHFGLLQDGAAASAAATEGWILEKCAPAAAAPVTDQR